MAIFSKIAVKILRRAGNPRNKLPLGNSTRVAFNELVLYETVTLALLDLRGVGPKSVASFWARHEAPKDPEELHKLLSDGAITRLKAIPSVEEIEHSWVRAWQVITSCESKEEVTILGRQTPIPDRLRSIPNPPLLLFVVGDHRVLSGRGVAVIGTREPSDFGRKSARRIAKVLAEHDRIVVSGLAEGCDTEGHEGCLEGDGVTIAVLAHGFGRIYPASNQNLADRIIESRGCWVSEYPPGRPPTKNSFIERDRLQSGLSDGIVVIETDVKGGAMHTVRHAESQQRGVAALAHPTGTAEHPKARGNQLLIKNGRAVPITDRNDLLRFVSSLGHRSQEPSATEKADQLDLRF